MNKDSTLGTIVVALVICLVCSVIVSGAAIMLKPQQEANKALDRKRNILQVVGLMQPGGDVNELFKQVETRIVDFETGEYVSGLDVAGYEQRAAAKDPAQNVVLTKKQDIAGIRTRAKYAKIYLVKNPDGSLKNVILPVHGYGLWSTLYGFLALKGDGNTVAGLSFYQHAETPGLGGEVDNPNWRAQWPGKVAFDSAGEPALRLVKGGIDPAKPSSKHYVDTLSGATLTSNGVTNLLQYWLGQHGFGPYLAKLRAQRG